MTTLIRRFYMKKTFTLDEDEILGATPGPHYLIVTVNFPSYGSGWEFEVNLSNEPHPWAEETGNPWGDQLLLNSVDDCWFNNWHVRAGPDYEGGSWHFVVEYRFK
jgi:hypothetical protein